MERARKSEVNIRTFAQRQCERLSVCLKTLVQLNDLKTKKNY
jgi:hypothetical protein